MTTVANTPTRRRPNEEATQWKDADDDDAQPPFHDQLPSVEEIRMSAATRSKRTGGGCGPVAMIVFAAVCIVGLIIGLSVGLSGGGGSSSTDNATTSSGGGNTQSSNPNTSINRLIDSIKLLSAISDETKLTTLYTPHNMAVTWLAEQDGYNLPIPEVLEEQSSIEFIERYLIALFYFSMNGPKWDIQLGFMSPKSVCEWQDSFQSTDGPTRKAGIGCNKGRIADLHLPGNRLKGSIPTEFGLLEKIWSLNLNSNQITGSLPDSMQSMTKMALLAMQHNELTGTVPHWLGKFTDMAVLYLGNNKYSSSLPTEFSKLTSLQSLALSKNELTGDLQSLESLPLLTHVYADRNLFEGTLEETFKFIPQMIELDLSGNRLRGTIPPYLFEMEDLEILDLHGNSLDGNIPAIMEDSALTYLSLHTNRLEGNIPTTIANAGDLTHVDLSANYLEGDIPTVLGDLENLKYLFLGENRFTPGPIPQFLANLEGLQDLSLRETGLTGVIPSFIMTLPELQVLDLQKNSLTGNIPVRRLGSGVSKLKMLLLNRNKLTGTVPEDFTRIESLDVLFLDNNNLVGDMDLLCGQADPPRDLSADCSGATPQVKCECCSTCCSDANPSCNEEHDFLNNVDPLWANSYVRKFYEFGPSITFDGSA